MSLRRLAITSFWRNRGRYIAYLTSASFSVMIFFLYTSLVNHHELQKGYRGAMATVMAMKAAAVVVAVFTFLFLLYSNSAFIRSRKKEFGLLSLLGFSKAQLMRLIVWEGVAIAGLSVAIGTALGLLFQKLFFMAISALLQLPRAIPFYAGQTVWVTTIGVFGSFFLVVSLASLRHVMSSAIVTLLHASRQPKEVPSFSRIKAALGLALVVGGYLWAASPHGQLVFLGMIPVTLMVSLGTYLLIREGSIATLRWLRQRKTFFYRPGPFFSVSQLMFKLQENNRILSAVAILIAVIITAVGTVFTFYMYAREDTQLRFPRSLQLVTVDAGEIAEGTAEVERTLERHALTWTRQRSLATYQATLSSHTSDNQRPVVVVPYSFYQELRAWRGSTMPLPNEHGALLIPGYWSPQADTTVSHRVLTLGGLEFPLQVQNDLSGSLFNPFHGGCDLPNYTLVVSDTLFDTIGGGIAVADRIGIAVWDGDDDLGRAVATVSSELASLLAQRQGEVEYSAKVDTYLETVGSFGLVLFVGVFVSLVFFAACCSLLYFRLFTEVEEDRRYYRRLQELGIGSNELRPIARRQMLVVFFVPFAVGLLHSTFAMKALSTILPLYAGGPSTVLLYGWVVGLSYLVLYTLYYRLTQGFYWRSLHISD